MNQKLRDYIRKKFEECFGENFQPSERMEALARHYKDGWRRDVSVWVRRLRR